MTAPTLVKALQVAGLPRKEAVLAATLHAAGGGLLVSEIVEASGLRQPEVSTGVAALVGRGVELGVDKVPADEGGPGRHRLKYTLLDGGLGPLAKSARGRASVAGAAASVIEAAAKRSAGGARSE